MKKFLLVCCYNGEFDAPQFFDNRAEAIAAMNADYNDMIDYSDMIVSCDSEITDFDAFVTDIGVQCYWRVFEINL